MAAKKKGPTPWKWVNYANNGSIATKGRLNCEAWLDSDTGRWHGTAFIASGSTVDRHELCVYTKCRGYCYPCAVEFEVAS